MKLLIRVGTIAGFVIGDVCLILAIVANFGGGTFGTIDSAGYLRFAATVFLGAITLGIMGFRQLSMERTERVEVIHFRQRSAEVPQQVSGGAPPQVPAAAPQQAPAEPPQQAPAKPPQQTPAKPPPQAPAAAPQQAPAKPPPQEPAKAPPQEPDEAPRQSLPQE